MIYYFKRGKNVTTPKVGLHPKMMLYTWWDQKGILYNELLLENQTINSNKHCYQLGLVKAAFNEMHPELVTRKMYNLPLG